MLGLNIKATESHSIRLTNCLPYSLYSQQEQENSSADTGEQPDLLKSWRRLLLHQSISQLLLTCLPQPETEQAVEREEEPYTRQELLTAIPAAVQQAVANDASFADSVQFWLEEEQIDLVEQLQAIDPSGKARQSACIDLMRLCPAIASFLLPTHPTN